MNQTSPAEQRLATTEPATLLAAARTPLLTLATGGAAFDHAVRRLVSDLGSDDAHAVSAFQSAH